MFDQLSTFGFLFQGPVLPIGTWSFLLTVACFFVSTPFYRLVSSHYRTLSREQQVDWNSRSASSLHAIVTTILPLWLMFTDPELRADPVNYAPVVAHQMMAITVGYLAGDFLVVFSHQKQFGVAISRQTMLHHFIGVVGFSIMILFRVFSWFAIFRLSSEASTVFINIRWMLATNPKWKSSWLYILNGSVMTIVFFAFRVGSLPYYYYVLVDAWPNMVATRETWQIITLLVFGSTIDTLNVYWFSKIWGGLMSMVRPRSKTQ